jgi:hypothetical protein
VASESLLVQAAGAALLLSIGNLSVHAYEGDVHYGLTKWLAQRAGFGDGEAEAIALGNHRVDSGAMNSLEVIPDYACAHKHAGAAQKMAELHFPSAARVPSAPAARAVHADSPAARRRVEAVLRQAKGREGQVLALFGAGLHTLQDSWSHAGTPAATALGAGVSCDEALSSGHPVSRGGPNAHDADLTHVFPGDVVPMAKATYDALIGYPAISSRQRTARPWNELVEDVSRFARARTKTEKREWFIAAGINATDFLEGVSLPDGANPGPLEFSGRSLPPLKDGRSTQWDAPEDARQFFDRLIARWLSSERIEDVVSDLASPPNEKRAGKRKALLRELTARMSLWKLRDHGAAAKLAHAPAALTQQQLAAVSKLTRDSSAFVQTAAVGGAFLPLIAKGEKPSPLLPYVVRILPPDGSSNSVRAIAFARLKHAPYDTVGWIAERSSSGWVLIDMIATVDH